MMLQVMDMQQRQTGGDPTFTDLQRLLEAAEPAGAAANVLVFLLLKASPADQLPQVCHHSFHRPPTCLSWLLQERSQMNGGIC